MSDLTFRLQNATLYGWTSDFDPTTDPKLFTVNQATGAATPLAGSVGERGGGGLAANSAGVLYHARSDDDTLFTLNPTTGTLTPGPMLTGQGFMIRSLAFDAADVLYGILSTGDNGTGARLVIIDTVTGAVTQVGDDMDLPAADGLVFVSARRAFRRPRARAVCPCNIVVHTRNRRGKRVTFHGRNSTACTALAPLRSCHSVTCTPPSGSFFPIGTTVVTCRGGLLCRPCTFTVTVVCNRTP
jgi:hypothetical protein